MLVNTLSCTGRTFIMKNSLAPNAHSIEVTKHCLTEAE